LLAVDRLIEKHSKQHDTVMASLKNGLKIGEISLQDF